MAHLGGDKPPPLRLRIGAIHFRIPHSDFPLLFYSAFQILFYCVPIFCRTAFN
jgi:hypothetical protein